MTKRPNIHRYDPLPPNLPPRLINRAAAAAYIGVSVTLFDQLINDGRMPEPKRINVRRLWDVRDLDRKIDALPGGDDEEEYDRGEGIDL